MEPQPHLTLASVTPHLQVLQEPGDSALAVTPRGALGTKGGQGLGSAPGAVLVPWGQRWSPRGGPSVLRPSRVPRAQDLCTGTKTERCFPQRSRNHLEAQHGAGGGEK